MMPLQRARGAESRVRNKLSNGPLRVQSKAQLSCRVLCNVKAYVSCRGYACILLSARLFREFKVAPRIMNLFVLDRSSFLSRAFFYGTQPFLWNAAVFMECSRFWM